MPQNDKESNQISDDITAAVKTAEDVHGQYQVEIDRLTRRNQDLREMLEAANVKVPVGLDAPTPPQTKGAHIGAPLRCGDTAGKVMEVTTLVQTSGKDMQFAANCDAELAAHLNSGWDIINFATNIFGTGTKTLYRQVVTLKREVTEAPPPPEAKAVEEESPDPSTPLNPPEASGGSKVDKPVAIVEPENPGEGETVIEFEPSPTVEPVGGAHMPSVDTTGRTPLQNSKTACGKPIPPPIGRIAMHPYTQATTGIVVRKDINDVTFEEAMGDVAGFSRAEVEAIGNREFLEEQLGRKVRINADLSLEDVS